MTNRHVPGPADVSRYTENYKAEVDGVALYEVLGRAEKNPLKHESVVTGGETFLRSQWLSPSLRD